jgi:hypothetical protein
MEAADGGRVKVLLPPVRLRFFVYSGYTLLLALALLMHLSPSASTGA